MNGEILSNTYPLSIISCKILSWPSWMVNFNEWWDIKSGPFSIKYLTMKYWSFCIALLIKKWCYESSIFDTNTAFNEIPNT